MGKRSLADLERLQYQQQGLNLFLRSVKQRTYQHASPISPLSPVDFAANRISPDAAAASVSTRYGLPLLHQTRPQPQPMMFNNISNNISNSSCNSSNLSTVSYTNFAPNRVDLEQDSEKMRNRLQELEKQLLDDNDLEDGDAGSAITSNEWSEIQNLISPTTLKPVSSSPTTSSTSSCSSSSASHPSQVCSKQLLIEAASAINDRNAETATEILTRLNQVSNVRGNSEQRLTAYVSRALKSRFNPSDYPPPVTELLGKEQMTANQLLYDVSPCFKLGFVAANLAILETLPSSTDKKQQQQPQQLHVVDFDIGPGSQYYHLIHALSTRCQSKNSVVLKITAVNSDPNSCKDEAFLNSVGEGLKELARSVGVTFHFRVVTQRISDLTRDSLGCEGDESLAVNLAFVLYHMADESVTTENPRDELLRRVKGLKPQVVTLVEQEMNANTAPFMVRVKEVVSYYGALFESLDRSSLSREDMKRVRLEEGLSRKMSNSVACEGRDRVERCEMLGKWRARMGMAGFEPKPMSPQVADTMRARLSSTSTTTASPTRGNGHHGFTVKEEDRNLNVS
ncbi:Transcription factor GRAS [Dillenia turbinata]|uniref:Transcription factor GRAS n=1 Tax=Dillenia turbinata TaxID=194707 RepID=A0AAN8ZDN4_9MAGN